MAAIATRASVIDCCNFFALFYITDEFMSNYTHLLRWLFVSKQPLLRLSRRAWLAKAHMRTIGNSGLSTRMRHAQHKVTHSCGFLSMLSCSIVDQLNQLAHEAVMIIDIYSMMNCYVGVLLGMMK